MKNFALYFATNDAKDVELIECFDTLEDMEDFAMTSDIHHAAGYHKGESKPVLEIC